MLESTEKGEVRKTVGNYRLILMNDPNLQGAFRLNMFTDKIDITRDLGWYRESDSLTDVDLKFLVVYLEKHYGLSNEKRIEDVIKVVANENRYHPVLDRINSITWDGGAPVYSHGGTENAVADMAIGRLTPGDLANIQEPETLCELLSDEDMEKIFQFKEEKQNETV